MWLFNDDKRKNPMDSDEYARCFKRIAELDSRIQSVETKAELVKTDVANLRGKFNQRLRRIQELEEDEKTETINKDEFVSFG
jgi:archaellum component FlaC